MKLKPLVFVAACAFAVPAMAKDIATVNGQGISKAEFDSAVKAIGSSQRVEMNDQIRQAILNEMIDREILNQEAEKAGLAKKDDVKMVLAASKKDILANAMMKEWVEKNPVSDKEVKEAYDKFAKAASNEKEYKAKHILIEDEAEAKELLKKIKDKKITFKKAAEKSIDTGSAEEGGELGWATPQSYTPEFAEAIKKAEKGELLEKPVKSKFGWHIIEVEDSRQVEVPKLKEVEPQLKQTLTQKKLQEYLEKLHKDAKIENKLELSGDSKDAKSSKDKE